MTDTSLVQGTHSMQSARRSTRSAVNYAEDAHESEFSEDLEHLPDAPFFSDEELSDKHSSDEDSDYGNSRKKGKGPPTKRAKKSSNTAHAKQSSAKGSRQKKSLSLLPAMPLDVLFEVFSHLTPKDIIHLSRTSRIFRDTLMMRSAISVWKAARERFGAPECPSSMSEPQWAVLLFGNLCQNCGAKNIPKPDFALLRRICISCKKAQYMVESKFKTRFLDVDPQVLELIPHTNVGAWSHGYARGCRFFWIPDIDAMLRKLAEYQHNIHFRRPGARQALQDFKNQQYEMIASIRISMRARELWHEQLVLGRFNDKRAVIKQRFESIQSKFIEMGYTKSDVDYIRSESECQQPALLTDRIWNRICPILEPTVLERKRDRLEREMGEIRFARRSIVHTSYQEYQKTLMPSQWKYLPRTIDICSMGPFTAVVDAGPDVCVSAVDFQDAFRQLPALISANSDARKLHARSLLKIPTSVNLPACSAPEPGEIASSSSNSLPPDALDLATAVFTCHETSCRQSCLFGWDDIAQHHCKSDLDFRSYNTSPYYWMVRHMEFKPGLPKIGFNALGSEITAAVVRAAGLDDNVATASDMDARTKDIRFGCSRCPPVKRNGTWRMSGYNWRGLVLHCVAKLHSPKDVLVVLPPADVAKVKESEMASSHLSNNLWTCGHCTIHAGDLKSRETVVGHLKSVHRINSPREPEDLFFFIRNPSLAAFDASYPVDAPATATLKTLYCLQCAGGRPAEKNRLFDLQGVRSHLSAKHKIKSPEVGIHYR